MKILQELVERAKDFHKKIVFPEGNDPRILQAAVRPNSAPQGLAMPVNDPLRGCSAEDVYYVAAITVLQASQLG